MRNKNIARILRGDGGNPKSEQRRNAQAHIIYYMCPLFVFYTNFRNGDARCKGPSLFPKTTPENEGETNSAENISHQWLTKRIIGSSTQSQTMPIWTTLTRKAMRWKTEAHESENMPMKNANFHFPAPKVLWKSHICTLGFVILSAGRDFFLP